MKCTSESARFVCTARYCVIQRIFASPINRFFLFISSIAAKQPLVVKPDQLIKRRGKLGLIAVNKSFAQVKQWVDERMNKDQKIGNAVGKLRSFIIEPFIPHKEDEEAYVCIYSHRSADTILFHHQGGVDIGDVDAKALKLEVPVNRTVTVDDIEKNLLVNVTGDKKQ